MVMGAFRYGCIDRQDFSKFDMSKEALRRINLYRKTKNLEYLVDAGNMVMLAYVNGRRNGESMISIDDGIHSQKKN